MLFFLRYFNNVLTLRNVQRNKVLSLAKRLI